MKRFLDAIADSYFIPCEDGTVRFDVARHAILSVSHDHRYLVLSPADAEAMKALWRPLVRYYLYAAHLCMALDFFSQFLGPSILFALWLTKGCLLAAVRRSNAKNVVRDREFWERAESSLSLALSRPAATSLWLGAGVIFLTWLVLAWTEMTALAAFLDQTPLFSFAIIVLCWWMFFGRIMGVLRIRKGAG